MQNYSQYGFHQCLQNPINPMAKSVLQHDSEPSYLAKPIWVLFVKVKYALRQHSPTVLAPGTDFMEDNFSID